MNEVDWTEKLKKCKRRKLMILGALFFKVLDISVSGSTFYIEIINSGEDKILKCDHMPEYWKRGYVDIFDGHITKAYNETYEIDKTNDNNDLKINQATFDIAGQYSCQTKNRSNSSAIEVIVIDKNITCNVSTLLLQSNEDFVINCSFTFIASDTCRAKPLWTEKISNINVTSGLTAYNNGYVWLYLNGSNGLKDGNKLWLRILFTCNMSFYFDPTLKNNWELVESIYDTKYISEEIKFSNQQGLLYSKWIIIIISVILFTISMALITVIICERCRSTRRKRARNMELQKIPQARKFVCNNLLRNPLPNQNEEYNITPYYSTSQKFRKKHESSSKVQRRERSKCDNPKVHFMGEISEYEIVDYDDDGDDDHYETCD